MSVRPGARFFLGRLPQNADPAAVSRDFLARLEHGGGGDGGLVLTLSQTGSSAGLDLAPGAAATPPAKESAPEDQAPEPASPAPSEEPTAEAPSPAPDPEAEALSGQVLEPIDPGGSRCGSRSDVRRVSS